MVKERALIYARESKYQARQGNRSPEEQVDEGLGWCQQQDVEPIYVDGRPAIIDAGKGASRHSKNSRRDGWELAQRIMAGQAPGMPRPNYLVTWTSSRTNRKLEGYTALREICVANNVLWVIDGRVWDMSRPEDRLATAVFAAKDEYDVDRIDEDVRRALRRNVRNGVPHGRTLYGYRRVYDEHTKALARQDPDQWQAPVVRGIYELYLAGHSTETIARTIRAVSVVLMGAGWWGIPTSSGTGRWIAPTVRRILRNPAYKGRRTHNGVEVGDAMWPALVDPVDWERVQTRLTARNVAPNRASPRAKLLSGVAYCGVCKRRLSSIPAWKNRAAYYVCRAPGKHVGRSVDRLDAYVTAWVLRRLAQPDAYEMFSDSEDPATVKARGHLTELRTELETAMNIWRGEVPGKKLSVDSYAEIETRLMHQITEAEREVRRGVIPIDVDLPPVERLNEWWHDDLTDEQRREYVAALISAVFVHRVGRGNARYDDAEFTTIEWRR